jgi:hypothetical protein
MAREPVCFACGSPTGPLPRLNRLPDGRVCPTCRDRLLDLVPPALPAPAEEPSREEAREREWAEELRDAGEDFLEGA